MVQSDPSLPGVKSSVKYASRHDCNNGCMLVQKEVISAMPIPYNSLYFVSLFVCLLGFYILYSGYNIKFRFETLATALAYHKTSITIISAGNSNREARDIMKAMNCNLFFFLRSSKVLTFKLKQISSRVSRET